MRVRLLGHPLRLRMLLLALIEVGAFILAPYVAAAIRFGAPVGVIEQTLGSLLPRGLCFAAAMLTCYVATGLYNARQRASVAGIALRIIASALGAFSVLALFFFVFPPLFVGRGALAITALVGVVASGSIRAVMFRVVDESMFKRRVLVYGAGKRATSIAQLRRRSDQRGFVIVGYVACEGEEPAVPKERLLNGVDALLEKCQRLDVDDIVVAMDNRRNAFPVQALINCRLSGINILDLLTFLERETGKIRLDVLNPSWLIFGDGFNRSVFRLIEGRVLDIIASLSLLLLASPLIVLTAIAIKLEDGIRAPILYRQRRVGLEGRVFDVLKFRSMRVDAEQDGVAQWAAKDDNRITRVGAIARIVRLDELPQIFNILAGDMRFIGPRPERPEFVDELSEQILYYRERHCVKPGLTGWAQLCYAYGASAHDAREKLQYDLYYVKNHSLLFDVSILLQTAEVVLWGKGAR